MSEAGLSQNIVDLGAYRAARALAANVRRTPQTRRSSYLLWYPGAGVALMMHSTPGDSRNPTFRSQGSVPVPEGA